MIDGDEITDRPCLYFSINSMTFNQHFTVNLNDKYVPEFYQLIAGLYRRHSYWIIKTSAVSKYKLNCITQITWWGYVTYFTFFSLFSTLQTSILRHFSCSRDRSAISRVDFWSNCYDPETFYEITMSWSFILKTWAFKAWSI